MTDADEVARLRDFIISYPTNSYVLGSWGERRDEMVLEWGYDPLSCSPLQAAEDADAWAGLSLLEKRQAMEAERESGRALLASDRRGSQ